MPNSSYQFLVRSGESEIANTVSHELAALAHCAELVALLAPVGAAGDALLRH